jgi:hypothetical protein
MSSNVYTKKSYKLDLDTDLVYNKTYEEEMEEQRKLQLAIDFFESRGVEVVSKYGHYRNIYNVLKDFGEYLNSQKELK